MKKYLFYFFAILIVIGSGWAGVFYWKNLRGIGPEMQPSPDNAELNIVKINGTVISVDIADTPEERAEGLSGRAQLPEDSGMFFVFEAPGYRSFWMKDMNFSIDIIWIDEDLKIVDISHDVTPGTFPHTFSPVKPAQYVLETNAGWAERNGIVVGSNVSYN